MIRWGAVMMSQRLLCTTIRILVTIRAEAGSSVTCGDSRVLVMDLPITGKPDWGLQPERQGGGNEEAGDLATHTSQVYAESRR